MHNRSKARRPAAGALIVAALALATNATADSAEADKAAQEALDELKPEWNQRPLGAYELEWDVIGLGEDRHRATWLTGFGLSATPWMPEHPRGLRLVNITTMVLLGDYGDTKYDAVHLQVGTDPRLSVYSFSDAIDVIIGPRARYTASGFAQDIGPRHSVSVGGALGATILDGFLTVELTGEGAYAVNDPFLSLDSTGDRWKPRFGVTLKTDICFYAGSNGREGNACMYAPTRQETIDLTVILDAALEAARPPRQHQSSFCDAADAAVTLKATDGCGAYDADGFFCRLARGLEARNESKTAIEAAARAHAELRVCYDAQRTNDWSARKQGRSRAIRLQYGSYAPEMRRALDCAEAEPAEPDPLRDEALRRACEVCPKACPARAPWTPKPD